MALSRSVREQRTYLVECFGSAATLGAGRRPTGNGAFLATLAIADDQQLLVLLRGRDPAAVERRCLAAGLIVDRVVEVTLTPAWRWDRPEPVAPRRGRASPR